MHKWVKMNGLFDKYSYFIIKFWIAGNAVKILRPNKLASLILVDLFGLQKNEKKNKHPKKKRERKKWTPPKKTNKKTQTKSTFYWKQNRGLQCL